MSRTPRELGLEKSRAMQDEELIRSGASFRVDEEGDRHLATTSEQQDRASEEMERDLNIKKTAEQLKEELKKLLVDKAGKDGINNHNLKTLETLSSWIQREVIKQKECKEVRNKEVKFTKSFGPPLSIEWVGGTPKANIGKDMTSYSGEKPPISTMQSGLITNRNDLRVIMDFVQDYWDKNHDSFSRERAFMAQKHIPGDPPRLIETRAVLNALKDYDAYLATQEKTE